MSAITLFVSNRTSLTRPVAWHRTLLLIAAIIWAGGVTSLQAETSLSTISDWLTVAQNNLIKAAHDFRASGQAAALFHLTTASNALSAASVALQEPAVQTALGAQFSAVSKALGSAQKNLAKSQLTVAGITPLKKSTSVIKSCSAAAKGVCAANTLIQRPLLVEVNPTKPTTFSTAAGFHAPGALVQFQIDMSGCIEAPTVIVTNATSSYQAIDLATVVLDPVTGRLTMVMGPDEGGASIQVSVCGRVITLELFNVGSKLAQSLPYGFPQDLTVGNYLITSTGTGCAIYISGGGCSTSPITLAPSTAGPIPLKSLKSFANLLSQLATAVATALSQTTVLSNVVVGSSIDSLSPDSMAWTITVTGVAGDCSCTATATLTAEKQ